jgi:hypothetical protein
LVKKNIRFIIYILIFLLQLSELEQRVVEAENRAEDAEGKVGKVMNGIYSNESFGSINIPQSAKVEQLW